jgi:hypothetical protein
MTTLPAPVASVLRTAAAGHLLGDVDRVAAALRSAGWTPATSGGAWALPTGPRWSVVTEWSGRHVSVFSGGDPGEPVPLSDLEALADELAALADADPALRPGDPDPDWRSWAGDAVRVDLTTTAEKDLGKVVVPAVLHLAVESADAPTDGVPPDVDAARRVAVDGSADARWTLAGEHELPDDVVSLLASTCDAAVLAALDARAPRSGPV